MPNRHAVTALAEPGSGTERPWVSGQLDFPIEHDQSRCCSRREDGAEVRMMCITGDLRSLKDGGSRRILPAWVDEYIAMRALEAEANWP